jgi:hypothetical protein
MGSYRVSGRLKGDQQTCRKLAGRHDDISSMALNFDEWSAAASRAEAIREHAIIGKGRYRLNDIL